MNFLNKKPVFFAAMAALFFAILLIVFRSFVFDSNQLMVNSDQLNGIGSRILRAQSAVLTEWDDSRLGGIPTIDATFSDAYHPLVWTQFLMDPARAVGFKFILTIWVAFMSAMLLAWSLTGNKWWGALLGFLYALSPEFFTYLYGGHDGKMMVFAIAPLAILAIRKVVREASIPYMIVLALSITWMILGSHLQLTYLFLWGAGLYTLYEVAFHCNGMATRGKRIGLAAIGLAFGLAISCIQIVPPYLYTTTQSVRGDDGHTNYGHAVSWSLHQEEMLQMLIPGFVGVDVFEKNPQNGDLVGSSMISFSPQEQSQMAASGSQGSPFYWGHNHFKLDHNNAGALLTFLGFLCLFLPGKRRWACFWGLGAVVALSYGMGDHSPLFKLWYNILPGVKNFRAPGMALFWLPLLLVMMASPVVKALADSNPEAEDSHRALKHGAIMYAILLVLAIIARFNWTLFIGPFGFTVVMIFAVACLGIMSLDDQKKKFSIQNYIEAYTSKLPGTPRIAQACVLVGFAVIGIFMASAQNLLNDPVTAPYFKPLNEIVMNATAGKAVPSFILVLVIVGAALFVFTKWKGSVPAKAAILAAVAGAELFIINGSFIQNVPENQYVQPNNGIVTAIKQFYKYDSDPLNTPRVLSLTQIPSLGGNSFPQYGLRNAEGIHDNELASYRMFRGDKVNANYLQNISMRDIANGSLSSETAHPFLDLMNIGVLIHDYDPTRPVMLNPTAMGEAYIFGEAVVMTDEQAISTLKTQAANRQEKIEESTTPTIADSTETSEPVAAEPAKPKFADEEGKFFYKEKVILSEKPSNDYKGSVATSGPIQGKARLVESPKMDTQVFAVESDRPGFMVVAGNYHPYWKATVNGQPAKVYKAFGTLRAVEIPAGKSEVRMEYRSVPFHICIKVGVIAALLLAAIGIFSALKCKKKKV